MFGLFIFRLAFQIALQDHLWTWQNSDSSNSAGYSQTSTAAFKHFYSFVY